MPTIIMLDIKKSMLSSLFRIVDNQSLYDGREKADGV